MTILCMNTKCRYPEEWSPSIHNLVVGTRVLVLGLEGTSQFLNVWPAARRRHGMKNFGQVVCQVGYWRSPVDALGNHAKDLGCK